MQDEHGWILVSGALDPREMISPKIPKVPMWFQLKQKPKFTEKNL